MDFLDFLEFQFFTQCVRGAGGNIITVYLLSVKETASCKLELQLILYSIGGRYLVVFSSGANRNPPALVFSL